MKMIDNGNRIQYRIRIEGSFLGISWQYEDPIDSDGSNYFWTETKDPSTFWWSDGNFACDCNRHSFLPEHLQLMRNIDECGGEIKIDRIIPIEGDFPTLELNETLTQSNP